MRTFTTTGGNVIQVGGSDKDTFGYQMDVETTAQRIEACCLSGQDTAAKWPVAGSTRGDDNDFGTTYVEVSIPDQHLWYYVDGVLSMETDVVTGTGTNSTTPGVFMILDKQHPATLKGDGYSTDVEYWMPVTYSGTGLHDAQWRTEFGKEIYISGASTCPSRQWSSSTTASRWEPRSSSISKETEEKKRHGSCKAPCLSCIRCL